jgi:hypothetical protein
MSTPIYTLLPEKTRARSRSHRHRPERTGRNQIDDGFLCKHCMAFVSSATFLSGVQNRNHCPYCLWSRHVDLYEAGDRLSACKAPMQPIGLTIKTAHKKYGSDCGELMLIHQCTDCGDLSINRIASDDDPESLLSTFEASHLMDPVRLETEGIRLLRDADGPVVRARLFGECE